MRKLIYSVVKVIVIVSVILTVIFALLTLSALIDRINYGSGLMFADVELLLIVTIFFLLFSIIILFIKRRIKNGNKP